MNSEILTAMQISASGMRAQGERIRVITENVANADTAAGTPQEEPYRRKTVTFKNVMDRELNARMVEVNKINQDFKTPFRTEYEPGAPGADENGYVRKPNVNTLIEMMDIREAQRSYEANLGMIEQARTMVSRTIDLLQR